MIDIERRIEKVNEKGDELYGHYKHITEPLVPLDDVLEEEVGDMGVMDLMREYWIAKQVAILACRGQATVKFKLGDLLKEAE
jgi:hypothetical protein